MLIKLAPKKMVFLALTTSILSACGGSSNSDVVIDKQPMPISSKSWESPKLGRAGSVDVTTQLNSNMTWSFTISGDQITANTHFQLYLDSDNNSATGFQFDGEVWSQNSGADYLIEDGILYHANRNNSVWSWETIEDTSLEIAAQQIKVELPITSISGLCNDYNIGVIGLSNTWDIEAYSPQSNSMVPQKIDYCDTSIQNKRPVITLADPAPLTIERDSIFVIPQATALDTEDGDISNSITTHHNVDISQPGNYQVVYSVKDSEGLYAIPVIKQIIVASPASNFTIDGLTNDWDSISPFATTNGKTLKVSDSLKDVFILLETNDIGANNQFYFDTDKNASTGFSLQAGGADYLLENAILYKFTGTNGNHWSWRLVTQTIPHIINQNVIELSIPKLKLGSPSDSIKLIYSSLTANWDSKYYLPVEMKTYTFQGTGVVNHAPDAVEDSLGTSYNQTVEIDVLANDTDPDGDTLSILSYSQPSLGTTTQLSNGKILFDPQGNIGSISFSYTVSDGNGGTDTAVVTIATTDPDDIAHSAWPDIHDENITVHRGQTIFINVLANDTDSDGDTLILDQVDNTNHGIVTKLNSTGDVKFTADDTYLGSDIFWYGVHDGYGHNGAGKVIITVIP